MTILKSFYVTRFFTDEVSTSFGGTSSFFLFGCLSVFGVILLVRSPVYVAAATLCFMDAFHVSVEP